MLWASQEGQYEQSEQQLVDFEQAALLEHAEAGEVESVCGEVEWL